MRPLLTDAASLARLVDVPTGRYTVQAFTDRERSAPAVVEVRAEEETSVLLELE